MTASIRTSVIRRPWHLWVAAALTAAIYLGDARDYLALDQSGPGGIAYFADYPVALHAVWMVDITAGLVAPCLLLALSRWAVPVAAVAAAAQAVLLVVTFGFGDRWDALGAATSWFDLGIGVVAVLFAGYCWAMRRRNLLS
ncbi:hypothetical protein Ait01nite_015860 [Actinoplanes italicus]|uniref:DoxX-like protein n=1 Tax=Actinoplanes italicus TaxID=113567 RepID=A0A2T0KHW2_9ACTN|nr:hypothetical protein [Actinoplanes italicus]PRX23022.1 hypothetical protein CLV67_104550 [Actinoplanes italicus]GIE28541.1 hypothetical protein Ait01nite_015860 [Actinoplanes italicus]